VWSSIFNVDNIVMNTGSVGVGLNFGAYGSVVNSRFHGALIAGVLLEGSDGARIADNHFVRNEIGVSGVGYIEDPISDLTVEANLFEGGFFGVRFQGISDSTVQDNVVKDNARGIFLEPNIRCQDPPGPECYYSIGNVITGNTLVGNNLDLYHHELCVPNTWERNICRTKEGAEIQPCWGDWRRPSRRLKPVSP
jgi:hypothetical protein